MGGLVGKDLRQVPVGFRLKGETPFWSELGTWAALRRPGLGPGVSGRPGRRQHRRWEKRERGGSEGRGNQRGEGKEKGKGKGEEEKRARARERHVHTCIHTCLQPWRGRVEAERESEGEMKGDGNSTIPCLHRGYNERRLHPTGAHRVHQRCMNVCMYICMYSYIRRVSCDSRDAEVGRAAGRRARFLGHGLVAGARGNLTRRGGGVRGEGGGARRLPSRPASTVGDRCTLP